MRRTMGSLQAPRGVVAARPPSLGAGLEDELAGLREDGRLVFGAGGGVVEEGVQGVVVGWLLVGPPRPLRRAGGGAPVFQLVGELLGLGGGEAGFGLQPLRALRGLDREDLLDGEPLAALGAHGLRLHALDVVAHQRFVDAADLLDVERLVAEAVALEDDEALEHGVHGAVVDGGYYYLGLELGLVQRGRARRDALEERVAVRVEEVAAPRRHVQLAVIDAREHRAEEDEELAPRAVALRHGVGVRAGVLLQALEEAEHAEVLGVGRVLDREQAPILREEQEDEAQHDREQAAVDVVVLALEGVREDLAEALGVALGRGLEGGEQDLERVEDLARQLVRDVRLALAALLEQRARGGVLEAAEEAVRAQQRDEGVEDRAAADLRHVRQAEGEVARGLAVRGVDEAELLAVREQAEGDAHVAKEAIELRGRRVTPLARDRLRRVEVEAGRVVLGEVPEEQLVRGAGLGGLGGVGALGEVDGLLLLEREGGPQELVRLGDVEAQRGGEGRRRRRRGRA
ncbi:MAG: hypothetical protein M5U28_23135 [Sandaracinaceae bacterium]|nr:hypothetical protein [Sandaracinaceae bacterium]